jgi:aminotransferase
VAVALDQLGADFYRELAAKYRDRRDLLYSALTDTGFICTPPEGAYYILCDFTRLSQATGSGSRLTDTEFAVWLSKEVGVTPVPGSSFFRHGGGESWVRFVFCKTDDVLLEATRRLRSLASPGDPNRSLEPATRSGLQQ